MDGIKRISLRDANEHTLITEVVYPMINALESKLDANLAAVEDFWELKYAKEGESPQQQNRVLLKRYLQSLKIRIQSLTGQIKTDLKTWMAFIYKPKEWMDFNEQLEIIRVMFLECKDNKESIGETGLPFIFTEAGDSINTTSPVYYISPFTVVKPQLKGNYNETADFLKASEVLTVSRLAPTDSPYFSISPLYWSRIDWDSLYPDLNLNWNEAFKKYDGQLHNLPIRMQDLEGKLPDEIKSVNVYKLVQFFDDSDDPVCDYLNEDDYDSKVIAESGRFTNKTGLFRDIMFKLSFAAIPTTEGYRLAPASFTTIQISQGRGFSYFLEKLNNREIVLEVINNYPAQGLFNWLNL